MTTYIKAHAKAFVAGLTALIGSLLTAGLLSGPAQKWATVAVAALTYLATHAVPNTPAAAPVAPATVVQVLPELHVEGRRLGRHVQHDPRSRAFAAVKPTDPLVSKQWARRSKVFDQGQVGSCTGNAAAGWLATDNAQRKGHARVTEATARKVYGLATTLDDIPGTWPPNDTGSSGLAAAKALVELKDATSYTHAFDAQTALATISHVGPVMVGMQWKTGCDQPNRAGLIAWTGAVRGGHEILFDEIDVENGLVWFTNSWSATWGVEGRACMTWRDFAAALAAQGDCTVPA